MERIGFIDQLKALSIFLIVYGHNDYMSEFSMYLSSFRLPLFFILSGYVRKDKSTLVFYAFIKKLGKRLLLPYFLFSIFLYVLWFFVGRHFGVGEELSPLKNFIGVLYSQGGPQYMDWGIPLWFLTALFCVLFIDFFVARLPRKFQFFTILIIAISGYLYYVAVDVHLPWSFDVAMVVYPFYFFGGWIQEKHIVSLLPNKYIWIIVPILFLFHLFLFRFNSTVSFYYGEYGIVFCGCFYFLVNFPALVILLG